MEWLRQNDESFAELEGKFGKLTVAALLAGVFTQNIRGGIYRHLRFFFFTTIAMYAFPRMRFVVMLLSLYKLVMQRM